MVAGGDVVVAVSFDALDGVLLVKAELLQDHVEHLGVHWHLLFAWEVTVAFSLLVDAPPGVVPHLFYRVASVWVRVQHFLDEIAAVDREELGQGVRHQVHRS